MDTQGRVTGRFRMATLSRHASRRRLWLCLLCLALSWVAAACGTDDGTVRTAGVDSGGETNESRAVDGSPKPAATSGPVPPALGLFVTQPEGLHEVQRGIIVDSHWPGIDVVYEESSQIAWPQAAKVSPQAALLLGFHAPWPPAELGIRIYAAIDASGRPIGAPVFDQTFADSALFPCGEILVCLNVPRPKSEGLQHIAVSGIWFVPSSDPSSAGPLSVSWLLRVHPS